MTNITDEMIKAGAAILDPLLSTDCPKRVARDVYEAMREVEGVGNLHSSVTLQPIKGQAKADWSRLGKFFLPRQTATSDGRW